MMKFNQQQMQYRSTALSTAQVSLTSTVKRILEMDEDLIEEALMHAYIVYRVYLADDRNIPDDLRVMAARLRAGVIAAGKQPYLVLTEVGIASSNIARCIRTIADGYGPGCGYKNEWFNAKNEAITSIIASRFHFPAILPRMPYMEYINAVAHQKSKGKISSGTCICTLPLSVGPCALCGHTQFLGGRL